MVQAHNRNQQGWLLSLISVIMIGSITCILPEAARGQSQPDIKPTDVYYLAASLDEALVRHYNLSAEPFQKKLISENLRPRDVFQKAITVVEEFQFLHPNTIDPQELAEVIRLGANDPKPGNVYQLLSLMQKPLVQMGVWMESQLPREPKVPSNVFQMLRQIAWHHRAIAQQQGLETNWDRPARVYDAVVNNVLPAAQTIAQEAGVLYQDYPFPPQPIRDIQSRHVYKLLAYAYANLATYYVQHGAYDPLVLTLMTDCDDISPGDVFDLALIVAAELKVKLGQKTIAAETAANYARWKETQQTILPGHVFRLVQYNVMLMKQILAQESE